MNVVVLYADDWRHDTLGVAGNEIVKTPEIDKLASKGVRFTQNAVTTAICGVSRATLFTGQWMSRHGCRNFRMFKTPFSQTYPAILRDKGYHVGHIGKWHNGKFPKKEYDFGRRYDGTHWMKGKDGKRIHVTKKNELDAMEFLKTRPKDKPFCLTLAFFAPHAEDKHEDQFLPQPESMELYKDVTIPVPETATEEEWEKLPHFFSEKNEGRIRYFWRFDTPQKFQRMMKNYYRLVSEVDAVCGKVVAKLEEEGILDNTLVIFTTDNGYYHAERGLADKWYPHQESIRVPLVILDPRMPEGKAGSTNDEFTLSVDLAPTILGAAGAKAPKTMQGKDMAPLYLAEKAPKWRKEFFYEHPFYTNQERIPESMALVRKDWKYVLWPHYQVEQLFNLKEDPLEKTDLIADASSQKQLKEMRARFAELREEAK